MCHAINLSLKWSKYLPLHVRPVLGAWGTCPETRGELNTRVRFLAWVWLGRVYLSFQRGQGFTSALPRLVWHDSRVCRRQTLLSKETQWRLLYQHFSKHRNRYPGAQVPVSWRSWKHSNSWAGRCCRGSALPAGSVLAGASLLNTFPYWKTALNYIGISLILWELNVSANKPEAPSFPQDLWNQWKAASSLSQQGNVPPVLLHCLRSEWANPLIDGMAPSATAEELTLNTRVVVTFWL